MTFSAENLQKAYGSQTVLSQISFQVESGEILAVVGRSGCGKTTLLRILAGHLEPDGGAVRLNGRVLHGPDSDRWMVFQSFEQLYPWFTVRRNLLYALRRACPALSTVEARALAQRSLAALGLEDAADKYPYQLSGGMQQRGSLARALALAPRVLLLDEPFSSLDAHNRPLAQAALTTLARESGTAVVLVTHDLEEAATLATQIALLRPYPQGMLPVLRNTDAGMHERLRQLLTEAPGMP